MRDRGSARLADPWLFVESVCTLYRARLLIKRAPVPLRVIEKIVVRDVRKQGCLTILSMCKARLFFPPERKAPPRVHARFIDSLFRETFLLFSSFFLLTKSNALLSFLGRLRASERANFLNKRRNGGTISLTKMKLAAFDLLAFAILRSIDLWQVIYGEKIKARCDVVQKFAK